LAGSGIGRHGGMKLADERIRVEVETQTFRFTPSEPIDHDEAVTLGGGSKSGEYVVISHEEPHATFVIEPEGTVLVHGISRGEVARLAIEELLYKLGMTNEWLMMDSGDMIVQFSIGRAVLLELVADRFPDANIDYDINALRIDASRHGAQIILFNNGHGIVLGQSSKRIAEMAIRHWVKRFELEGALA